MEEPGYFWRRLSLKPALELHGQIPFVTVDNGTDRLNRWFNYTCHVYSTVQVVVVVMYCGACGVCGVCVYIIMVVYTVREVNKTYYTAG